MEGGRCRDDERGEGGGGGMSERVEMVRLTKRERGRETDWWGTGEGEGGAEQVCDGSSLPMSVIPSGRNKR